MPRTSAGRVVAEGLFRAGIRHAFTVPGESFLELLDALRDTPIRVVATRHEAGAGFMAEAYAQLSGLPAACLVTRAVGTANLSIALHAAMQDSVPLVAIAGQVPRPFRGREAFQEADLVGTFGGLCKAAAQLDDPAAMGPAVEELVRVARGGRPGPVLIALPEDALEEAVDQAAPGADGEAAPGASIGGARATAAPARPGPPARPAPSDGDVRDVLRLLAGARRPVIVAGRGVRASAAVADLVAFAEAAELPVVAAWRRTDVFPNASPRYLGSTGLSAPRTVQARLAEADVILAIGTRLSETATFGYTIPRADTVLVRVDIDPVFRGDRPAPALVVRADARTFLRAAGVALGADDAAERGLAPGGALLAARVAATRADRAAFELATRLPDPGPRSAGDRVHPASVIAALRRHLADDAILTTDAGNFAGWAARHLPVPPRGRFIGPTSGAMGFGLPAAIGAALAARDLDGHGDGGPGTGDQLAVEDGPGAGSQLAVEDGPGAGDARQVVALAGDARQVVALAGDGGAAMLLAEIETAVRERLRVAVIVFDNAMYGTIRGHQERAHPGRVLATDLGPIDFGAAAIACGARAIRVERDADADAAVAIALADPGVSLVHVLTDPRILSVDARLA